MKRKLFYRLFLSLGLALAFFSAAGPALYPAQAAAPGQEEGPSAPADEIPPTTEPAANEANPDEFLPQIYNGPMVVSSEPQAEPPPPPPQPQAAGGLSCSVPIRIMPVGDSITQGSASGTTGGTDPRYYISYRKDLWDSLIRQHYALDLVGSIKGGAAYTDFDPDHEGHGGKTDDYVASYIYDWLTANPADVVLLHIGTNDIHEDEPDSPEVQADDVERILNEIDRYNPDVWVIVARIVNRVCDSTHSCTDWSKGSSEVTKAFNDNVMAMVDGRISSGDRLLKVNLETNAGLDYRDHDVTSAGNMKDEKHPYATGYKKMATRWESAINDVLPWCARQDAASTSEDSAGITIDVLGNDGGEALVLQSVGPGSNGGTVSLTPDGKVSYKPAADFFGQETFTYQVANSEGKTPPPAGDNQLQGVVTVTVTPVDDGMSLTADTLTAAEDEIRIILPGELTANDYKGPANEPELMVTAAAGSESTHGTVMLAGDRITYTPATNYNGAASFAYTACDDYPANKSCQASMVYLTVAPVNDLPTISPLNDGAIAEDKTLGPISFTVSDLETPAESLTVSAGSGDAMIVPTANINFGGTGVTRTLTLTPGENQYTTNGGVEISISVADPDGGTATESFMLTVTPVEDSPVVKNPGPKVFLLGETVRLQLEAADPEGKPVFFTLKSTLPKGLSLSSSGLITGVPLASGSAEITVEVREQPVSSPPTTISFFISVVDKIQVFLPVLSKPVISGGWLP